MKLQLTIGSDPEFMIRDNNQDKIVSAIPIIQRGKKNPIKAGRSSYYYDNVNIEGTVEPGETTEGTVRSFRNLVDSIAEMLQKRGCSVLAKSSHTFDDDELQDEEAREAGCSTEFCAHTLEEVTPPQLGQTNFRSAGGHIHIGRVGYKELDNDEFLISRPSKAAAIRAMDHYVGTALAYLENDPSAHERKELYGKAGRFRPTLYGVEYRTPSPYWVSHPALVEFTDKLTRYAMEKCADNPDYWLDYDYQDAAEIINSGDAAAAHAWIKAYLPEEFVKEAEALKQLQYNPDIKKNYE